MTILYRRWVKCYDTLTDEDRAAIRAQITSLPRRPLISVLMPTYNPPEIWLRRAIESVQGQLYPDWELCIADDASTQPYVKTVLKEYGQSDKRIRIAFRDHNGHISAASNTALQLVTGDFVALLDHDDELPEHALYYVAQALNEYPGLNLIYSDEDKIDRHGRRFGPYFKPDWNPDLLTAQNTVSHLGVYRTDVLRAVGGFRKGVEGSQDWDLALRVTERIPPSTIHHIPHVLYHWRAFAGSAAAGPGEKSYVAPAGVRAVQDHLQRQGSPAVAEPAFSSFVRVRCPLPKPAPMVSLLLAGSPSTAGDIVRRTRYPAVELISRGGNAPGDDIPFRRLEGGNSRAEWFNLAAQAARGEILCFLDADGLPADAGWLEELTSHARRPEIGAVGPLLLDAEGGMMGAQTVLWDNPKEAAVVWNYYQGLPAGERGDVGRAGLLQNLSVLPPACLVMRAATFKELNGLDAASFPEALFSYDLCLRLLQAGYRNLWTPYARLAVASASSPDGLGARHREEYLLFRERWGAYFDHDPAHNPNLARGREWPLPAFPPQTVRPWRQNRD